MESQIRRVLLAEDCEDTQALFRLMLTKGGVDVKVVANGHECVEEALAACHRGEPYDVILVDLNMPELDGCSSAQHLRQRGYQYPIVAITSGPSLFDMRRSMHSGCDGFLAKTTIAETIWPTLHSLFAH